MSKIPPVNCRPPKNKKKKNPTVPPQDKKFCPFDFVRYDNTNIEYKTVWVCKNCCRIILSENQVRAHMGPCKLEKQKIKEEKIKELERKKFEVPSYLCEICNKVFSRKVVFKKHIEVHQLKSDGFESDDRDDKKYVQKLLASIKQEPINYSNTNDVHDEFQNPIAGPSGVKYVPSSAIKQEPLSSDED